MSKYGLQVIYTKGINAGQRHYLGKLLKSLVPYNAICVPNTEINGHKFTMKNLDAALIDRYGWSTKESAIQGLELMKLRKKYRIFFSDLDDNNADIRIVELSSDLKEIYSFVRAR